MFRTILLASALLVSGPATLEAQTRHTLFDGKLKISVPETYERMDVRDFDWGKTQPAGIAYFAARQERENPDPVEQWADSKFPFGARPYVKTIVAKLISPDAANPRDPSAGFVMTVPKDSSARVVHNHVCKAFSARWGKFTFDIFDARTSIGRCVNYVGAFVAVFTRKIGNILVVAEAADPVEIKAAASNLEKSFAQMSAVDKWEFFRSSANADAAEQILSSARVVQ